jgi:hypothetical protein
MIMFSFGSSRLVHSKRRRGIRNVAEYALHVQCAWRFRKASRILVGFQDMYYPAIVAQSVLNPDDFDWDFPGANRCDCFFETFLSSAECNGLCVTAIRADQIGGFEISFSDDFALDVFPDVVTAGEVWRVFKPEEDTRHDVMWDDDSV